MTAAIIIIAVLLIINLTPVGVIAEYSETGLTLSVAAGLISVRVLPSKPKRKKEKKPKKEKKKASCENKTEEKPPKKPGRVKELLEFLPSVKRALGRFRRRVRINYLTLYYTGASDDPFKTAMTFGAINAGAGTLMNLLGSIFNIRKYDIITAVSFTSTEPYVYAKAKITLLIGQAVWIALCLGGGILKTILKQKGGKKDGQTSDRRSDEHDNAEDQRDGRRKHDNRYADQN